MDKIERLIDFIEKVKHNPKVSSYSEEATKNAIIQPLLRLLGWDPSNVEEVVPQYCVQNGRVDYSLRLNNSDEFFLEVKRTGIDLEEYQEQLLDYSFRQGVELAGLTNGTTWWFYLPMKKGSWETRKFYSIDIHQQESKDIASKFVDLLSKDNIQAGRAVRHAESIYKGRVKKEKIKDALPEAWNNIISESISEKETLLLDLIAETTEKLCGFKPGLAEVAQFLKPYKDRFLLPPEEEISAKEAPRSKSSKSSVRGSNRITRDDLIHYIVMVLQKHGGRARKDQVDSEIYRMLKGTLDKDPWYKETVSHGIPRWKHNIAWAKEEAKRRGLIKDPAESGRGWWELTEGGKRLRRNNSI